MKIIPTPVSIEEKQGTLTLSSLRDLRIADGSDRRITKIANTLKGEIEELTGTHIRMKISSCGCTDGGIYISHGESGEGYTLSVMKNGIEIQGQGAQGAYYGVQTLRQIIHEYGDTIPCCTIEDAPDFPERGLYHDVTRGRVPTLKQLCHIADMLAYYKINHLQLYVEDAYEFVEYDGIMSAKDVLTAEEILALDDYCYDNFIELVPSLATFGHLYNLLQSEKYRHLCELPDYKPTQVYWIEKMAHHTIDVSNPESIELIKSMIDQFIPLCRSNRFNICCDETMDLCRGRNAGKDPGEEYFKFLSKIIAHVKSRGKTVMMWGDIALEHSDKLSQIPADTIMLNWTYEKDPDEGKVKAFADANLKQIVCPGTSSWNRFVEEIDRSEGNITKLVEYGAKYGALGVLNTNWGDFGNICSFNCSLYGIVIGAEKGWNADGKLTPAFEQAASSLLYDSDEVNMIEIIRTMGRCERTCDWMEFMYWFSANTVEGRKTELPLDVEKAIANIKTLDGVMDTIRSVSETDERFVDLLLACRAIQLMNQVCLRINKVEGYLDGEKLREQFEQWLVGYRAAWLRDNKESQLELIADFVREISCMEV